MITGRFPPDASVGVLRSVKFCRYLPEFGWTPEVLAHKSRPEIDKIDPSSLRELSPDLVVHRTGHFDVLDWPYRFKARRRSGGNRSTPPPVDAAINDGSGAGPSARSWKATLRSILLNAPDRMITWLPHAVARGLGPAWKADCIYSSIPPYTPHLAALVLHRLTGRPLVLDFRDPWGDDQRPDLSARQIQFHRTLEAACVRRAAVVIHATQEARDAMIARFPDEPVDKFATVYNGYDQAEMPPAEHRLVTSDPKQPLRLGYFGNLYGTRSPEYLFEALRLLREQDGIDERRIELHIVGGITAHARQLVEEMKLDKVVRLVSRIPRAEALRQMCQSGVLALIGAADMDQFCIATKVYEYLAAGRPILALVPPGPILRLLEHCQAGHPVPPGDPVKIAAKLKELLARHESTGLALEPARNLDKFTRRHQTGELAKLLEKARTQGRRRRQDRQPNAGSR